ncbi:hypothetical protein EG834_13585 [bacterium]|nr:hypothetical protein [bacterium]
MQLLEFIKRRLRPTPPPPPTITTTGQIAEALLVQLDILEAHQKKINESRASMAELAAKLKNSDLLARINALADEATPKPKQFDKKDFDSFEDMYS